jgi:hypothetical protein
MGFLTKPPLCGSFELRLPDGLLSRYFCWDDIAGPGYVRISLTARPLVGWRRAINRVIAACVAIECTFAWPRKGERTCVVASHFVQEALLLVADAGAEPLARAGVGSERLNR